MKKQLIIDIKADGTTEIETKGFKGNSCEKELKPFEQSLGRVLDRKHTSEYYEQDQSQNNDTHASNG